MESNLDQVELLQAVIALAAADGTISASERGVLTSLAVRAGVGKASLDAMVERALNDASVRDDLFRRTRSEAERALELLVAMARLDGEITEEERELLVHVTGALNIPTERFADIYRRGVERADALRQSRPG